MLSLASRVGCGTSSTFHAGESFPGIHGGGHALAMRLRQNHPVQIRSLTPPFGKTAAPLTRRVVHAPPRLGRGTAEPALNAAFAVDYPALRCCP
jgi:hypothetical protein